MQFCAGLTVDGCASARSSQYDELVATGRANALSPLELERRVLAKGKVKQGSQQAPTASALAESGRSSQTSQRSWRTRCGSTKRETAVGGIAMEPITEKSLKLLNTAARTDSTDTVGGWKASARSIRSDGSIGGQSSRIAAVAKARNAWRKKSAAGKSFKQRLAQTADRFEFERVRISLHTQKSAHGTDSDHDRGMTGVGDTEVDEEDGDVQNEAYQRLKI